MRFVFFGTPDYVVPVLELLHKTFKSKTGEFPIAAVVTQPPKPTGRKKELTYSPVDEWAYKKGVSKFFKFYDLLKNNITADVGILASYGEIIPTEVINLFQYGILNIHPSILPLWRGASPVQATIISETQAGSSIIKLDEKLDHGPIIAQFKDELLPDDTSETLRKRLFKRSAEVLVTLIPAYLSGKITPRKQDHSKATFTREIKKSDGFIPPEYLNTTLQGASFKGNWKIDFMRDFIIHPSPSILHNFIRAMQPWPGTWTNIRIRNQDLRLKILKSHLEPQIKQETSTTHRTQSTKHNLVLDEVQLEGKNPVPWKQFKEGYPGSNLA